MRKYLTTSSDTFGNISFKFSKNSFSGNTFTDYTDLLTNLSINSKYKITLKLWSYFFQNQRIVFDSLVFLGLFVVGDAVAWKCSTKSFSENFCKTSRKTSVRESFLCEYIGLCARVIFEKFDRPN